MQRAAVAILLISADFLASDFIADDELPQLLRGAQSDGVKILPIILKPCAFNSMTSISQFQAVNDPAKPLISLDESQREQIWVTLAQATKEAIEEFKAKAMVAEAVEQATPSSQSMIKWNKVATLFWLGNDLMWIQDMMYRAAPPERILQGVKIALQYTEDLGFTQDSLPIQDLLQAKLTLEPLVGFYPSTEENRLVLEEHYRKVQRLVQNVKWYMDSLATAQQPGFKKLRALEQFITVDGLFWGYRYIPDDPSHQG